MTQAVDTASASIEIGDTVVVASLRDQKKQVKRGIALLTFKEVNKTLTSRERQLLDGLRRELSNINGRMNAPKRPKPVSRAPRTRQGPASGVTSVVSGGSPGSGKRS
jgi:hypothetical protein